MIKNSYRVLHLSVASVSYAPLAQMAELVDALASGASVRMDVEVQVLFWAPFYIMSSPFHDVKWCSGKQYYVRNSIDKVLAKRLYSPRWRNW